MIINVGFESPTVRKGCMLRKWPAGMHTICIGKFENCIRFLGGRAGGYIMAIVSQHRLLADLGPEYMARLGGIIAAVDNPCIAEPKECLRIITHSGIILQRRQAEFLLMISPFQDLVTIRFYTFSRFIKNFSAIFVDFYSCLLHLITERISG